MPAINLRKFHNKISPIVILPLLLCALSGVAYRIGRSWFGLSDGFGDLMMIIHQGEFLGKPLVAVYVLLVGLGAIAMIITGITLLKQRRKPDQILIKPETFSPRRLHRFLAPIFCLPLLVSALTGIVYRLGKSWFGLSDAQAKFFLSIHQGNYLGTSLRAIYVLLVALGLLAMIVTGFQMMNIFRSRAVRS